VFIASMPREIRNNPPMLFSPPRQRGQSRGHAAYTGPH
jgi:hypothetical protein